METLLALHPAFAKKKLVPIKTGKNRSIQIRLSQEIHLSSMDWDRFQKKVSQFIYSYMLLSPQVLQIKSKNDVLENDMQLYKHSNVELCLKASYQFL